MSALYEPLTSAQRSRLRESILTEGVRDPVLISSLSGRILSGANRAAICAELDLPYETREVTCHDETDELVVMVEHNPQRRVKAAERTRSMGMLLARGWSIRRAADMLGLDPETARRSVPGASPEAAGRVKVVGRDGSRQPARRYTAAEQQQRDALIVKLWGQGYARQAIRDALDVSNSVIQKAVAAAGLTGVPRTVRTDDPPLQPSWLEVPEGAPEVPEVIDMPTLETPPVRRSTLPAYKGPRSIAEEIRRVLDLYAVDRWALRACHDVDEAEAAGDDQWLSDLTDAMGALAADLTRLVRIVQDPAFRNAQSRVEDGSPPPSSPVVLRAVK